MARRAAFFTPWLALEENISLLGNALGIELEVESTEVAAGPYSADILGRDSATGDYVVIENQLGRTDHDLRPSPLTLAPRAAASSEGLAHRFRLVRNTALVYT